MASLEDLDQLDSGIGSCDIGSCDMSSGVGSCDMSSGDARSPEVKSLLPDDENDEEVNCTSTDRNIHQL